MPILRRSQALGEEAATDPQPLCHLLGPADRPDIFSPFPHPRGGAGCVEGQVPPRGGDIGMGLAQETQ